MTTPPPVEAIERRLRWPALPTLLFLGFLVMLLLLAGVSLWLRPQHPVGLPDDAALLTEAGLPDTTLAVLTDGLRFRAAALGGEPTAHTLDAASLSRVERAERALAHWARRHPTEPRVRAALGALALVRHDYRSAADRYKEACERSPRYAEGRLGWGVALALDAERTPDAWARRARLLRAIAQFAAVDEQQPEHALALWNRASLLDEVGRRDEALTFARAYLALDARSAHADRLRAALHLSN
jgi:tetratricopeptide (TPR) repeat protein